MTSHAGWARWLVCPSLFFAASIHLFARPDEVLSKLPSLVVENAAKSKAPSLASLLVKKRMTMTTAFKLGALRTKLQQEFKTSESTNPNTSARNDTVESILHEASNVLGTDITITPTQLDDILSDIIQMEAHEGPIARILGFFSFVNTLWVLAVVGITISVGPSIYYLLHPLHNLLRELFLKLYDLVWPILTYLHSWGLLELGAWGCCTLGLARGVALASSTHGPANPKAGEMVSLTASMLTIPALAYTSQLHGQHTTNERLATACCTFFAACCAPAAVHFKSTLYGYLTVVSAFAALGLGVWIGPLCVAVGFTSDAAMHRVAIAALVIVICFCAMTAAARNTTACKHWLAPFASAISTFGTTNLFLSLLIISSHFYAPEEAPSSTRHTAYSTFNLRWLWSNALVVTILISLNAVSQTLGLEGMANTSTTFTVLFALQKYGEFHIHKRWNAWLLILGASFVTWQASLFLNENPEFISSVIGGEMAMEEK